jgi:mycobactin phenyloxazoline synthetase
VPIGQAFPGQAAEPKGPDGAPVALGEVGELWLSGEQVSAGYLGDAALTAQRFVERDGVRWYKSGDRAALAASGNLSFFGREDLQVKLMGYRVELGEVEHALRKASGSPEALALVLTRNGIDELVAALPASAKSRKVAIRHELHAVLPGYMRPRRYCFLDAYPLNTSGKVDRLALTRALALARAP